MKSRPVALYRTRSGALAHRQYDSRVPELHRAFPEAVLFIHPLVRKRAICAVATK